MGELERTADRVVVIDRGRLVADLTTAELSARADRPVLVRTDRPAELAAALAAAGGRVEPGPAPGELAVRALDAAAVGTVAAGAGVAVHGLEAPPVSLEDAYLALTGSSASGAGAVR
jgi:ABC-2 type transport system ATP-binding protein